MLTVDLQRNGTSLNGLDEELGTSGLELWSGFVQTAYDTKLFWPDSFEIFNRLRRADPEIGGIVRPVFAALGRGVRLDWETPDEASDDDQRAADYGREVLEDLDGGISRLLEMVASYVPFMGWAWWEELWGLRSKTWRPPDPDDEWRSAYDDGLPTIRRLAWRDHSSFERWEANEKTGRVTGLVQHDMPNAPITIPRNRSLHLTFGDPENPEGLTPLEAVWRLERLKYGLEVIQGLGFQHAAGYARFQATAALETEDKAYIKEAARAMMTPQGGNFIRLPGHISAEILDSPFSAASSILEAIRYYGLLKLQIFTMQWVAMSTTANTGALSTHSDSSEMAIMVYNAMWDGFADQMNEQIGKRLFSHPAVVARFPGMTKRPRLIAIPIEKTIPLNLLSQFASQIAPIVPFGDDDIVAIRRMSGFLPGTLPPKGEIEEVIDEGEVAEETPSSEGEDVEETLDGGDVGEVTTPSNSEMVSVKATVMYSAVTELLTSLREAIDGPSD